jgi:hypothetical protein
VHDASTQNHRPQRTLLYSKSSKAASPHHAEAERRSDQAKEQKGRARHASYVPTHIFSVKIAAARWMGRALKFWLSLGTVHQKQIGWTASSCGISFAWPNTVCRCTFKGIVEVRPADWRRKPVRLAGDWWLVLVCSERKVLVAGGWFVLRGKDLISMHAATSPTSRGEGKLQEN